jgi:hypothetical protein
VTEAALEHGPECPCTRCEGFSPGNTLGRRFEPGNTAALRTGAYVASSRLGPRVDELTEETIAVMPVFTPADRPAVELFAITRVRIEIAQAALNDLDEKASNPLSTYLIEESPNLQRLREDLGRWTTRALRLADALGMTPTSRARLGLDIAATRRQLSVIDYYERKADEA